MRAYVWVAFVVFSVAFAVASMILSISVTHGHIREPWLLDLDFALTCLVFPTGIGAWFLGRRLTPRKQEPLQPKRPEER